MGILCKKYHCPTRMLHTFAVLVASCTARKLAVGPYPFYTKPFKSINMTTENNEKRTGRIKHIDIRLTEAEYSMVKHKASECGMTLSDYGRRLLRDHRPHKRLSDTEVEALNALSDARADLIRIQNVLRNKPDEVKRQYFKDYRYMQAWIEAVDGLITRWGQIRDNINQK